jgi:flagellar basal-body rod modification protein FlgD
MRYQNPLDPLDTYQMGAQMAQFSSLEALNQMSQSLQNVAAYQSSMSSLQTIDLIGKKIEVTGDRLMIANGTVSEGYYQLSKPGTVTIQIYDTQGNLIRTIEEGVKDNSRQKLVWNGKNQQGVMQSDGMFTFQVSAMDGNGKAIPTYSSMIDTVTGIYFENGVIYLNLGSVRVTLSDVIGILS